MQDTGAIAIEGASRRYRPLFEHLMELYLYDFSEFMGWDLDEHGRFFLKDLDGFVWTEAHRHPYLIRVHGRVAGFALVDRRDGQSPDDPEWEMAEFFVLRKYRRQGIAEFAAQWLFERHPGRWQVQELAQNAAAISFWRRVIERMTQGSYREIPTKQGVAQLFTV